MISPRPGRIRFERFYLTRSLLQAVSETVARQSGLEITIGILFSSTESAALQNVRCADAVVLFPAVHVPARIHPLAFAVDEDFGDAAAVRAALASGFEFIQIV